MAAPTTGRSWFLVRSFLDLIGVIRTETTVAYTSYGSRVMYDEPLVTPYVLVANVQWFDAFNPGYQVSLNVAGIDRTSTGAYGVGAFLVRDAPVVPLPGGFLLLGSAIAAAIAALSWWRRRSQGSPHLS